MAGSPLQIRLLSTDVNESANWTSKGATTFSTVDPYYSSLGYYEIQNPIPRAFDYFKTNPGVGTIRTNETAVNSAGGGYYLGGTASVMENALSNTIVGDQNKIDIKNLAAMFMTARNQGGLTMSLLLNAKQDLFTTVPVPTNTESKYLPDTIAAGLPFNANTFYKTSAWISFHSREASTASLTPSISSLAISFRKNFHHGFINLTINDIAGISQDANTTYIRAWGTFDWVNQPGLSANATCTFNQMQTSVPPESISATDNNNIITCANKSLVFQQISGIDAIFTNPSGSTTLFNSPTLPNQTAQINWGNINYGGKWSIKTPGSFIIRPRYSATYGTKNLLAIDTTSSTTTRFFGGTSNIGITAGSYIQISGSSVSSNNGIYQVVATYDGVPGETNENISGTTLPKYQYLELSREITGVEAGATSITVKNVSKLPIVHVKYTVVQ